jgi:hypothetical protein
MKLLFEIVHVITASQLLDSESYQRTSEQCISAAYGQVCRTETSANESALKRWLNAVLVSLHARRRSGC